ncbi:hypothetical protein [Streptomyces sp. NRRL F-2580]|uniref:hypothetical protein n=1 Tax=Streptomyces sp. NRRL F-2580 TaxID=1463841 RepID=UPI000AFA10C6|nr:hypothetical protein [Streptomyces sp. NRRL F-2580]
MHGQHARPSLFGPAPAAATPPPGRTGAKHSRRGRITGRLRRRILAYRAIEFLSTHIPGDRGPGEERLLLVHIRQVVGEVQYRICADCAQGVITAIVIDDRFHGTGLGTRALSHLRARHPGLAWRSTLRRRATEDLLRRMRIPALTSAGPCAHAGQTLSDPTSPILATD